MISAVHNCPQWPKWMLQDDSEIQRLLGLTERLGTQGRILQYYDTRNNYWVFCSPTYPHTVKKDGYLLLRRRNASCHDFETHLANATQKPTHFRDNLPAERKFVKTAIDKRRKPPPIDIISLSDIEAEEERRGKRKRSDSDDECITSTPIRRHQLEATPSATPSRSPSVVIVSPIQSQPPFPELKEVHVPTSCIRWPDGMYVKDMAAGFQLINSSTMKKRYPRLSDRTQAVFRRLIPDSTYFDHRRHWKNASEMERIEYVREGRTDAGLWSEFPKHKLK